MKTTSKLTLLALAIFSLSACERNLKSDTYTSSSSTGLVLEGVIVSSRPVTIKESDKLQDNGAGLLAGGVGGAAVGNTIGGGRGRTVSTVGGAIAGAVLGAVIQDQLSTSQGFEYIVRVNEENAADEKKNSELTSTRLKDPSINERMKNSIHTKMKTKMISVVQGQDVVFATGQKVYVIYSDDRPRLVAAEK